MWKKSPVSLIAENSLLLISDQSPLCGNSVMRTMQCNGLSVTNGILSPDFEKTNSPLFIAFDAPISWPIAFLDCFFIKVALRSNVGLVFRFKTEKSFASKRKDPYS